jgi:hypothetical protein
MMTRSAAVIDTISKDFPLNVMYWVKNEDGTFEVHGRTAKDNQFLPVRQNDFSM